MVLEDFVKIVIITLDLDRLGRVYPFSGLITQARFSFLYKGVKFRELIWDHSWTFFFKTYPVVPAKAATTILIIGGNRSFLFYIFHTSQLTCWRARFTNLMFFFKNSILTTYSEYTPAVFLSLGCFNSDHNYHSSEYFNTTISSIGGLLTFGCVGFNNKSHCSDWSYIRPSE